MGKIIDNKDGTHSMNGFSNNSEEDMRELGDKFISIESYIVALEGLEKV